MVPLQLVKKLLLLLNMLLLLPKMAGNGTVLAAKKGVAVSKNNAIGADRDG